MSPPWDVFGVGAAVGGAVGLYGGYQLRKLVVRIQEHRANHITKRDLKKAYGHDKTIMLVERQELPPVIPIKRSRRSTPNPPVVDRPDWSPSPWRDDVVAALTGAGYKKADAVKAVDACSLAERASGPEHWTIAALRHAHGAK